MVAFGHTSVGSLIGLGSYHFLKTTDPTIGLLSAGAVGLVSHYICDFIPHGHFISQDQFKSRVYLEIIFNLFLSIILVLGFIYLQEGLSLKSS